MANSQKLRAKIQQYKNVSVIHRFSASDFTERCDKLAAAEPIFKQVLQAYGYPPMWSRPQGFASLIHIILEQQVSLASAKAAFDKLQATLGSITPEGLMGLSDETLKACYFSRQKTLYARGLATAILMKEINPDAWQHFPDDEIRSRMKQLKGIGDWTVDIYLLFTLQRSDIFPLGDLAMVNALKELKQLPAGSDKAALLSAAANWRPNRSLATMMLWHYYLERRKARLQKRNV
ncbi:MAG: DNA-3-methyladenine glycosylase 2 family protein [Bacteroidota bacterium]|nr:DNA-3-methyladenine glycosylase 2 family protein [Bacteroidota bacterium]